MPGRLRLPLGVVERETLIEMRDHHARAYMRERAAALLKIAAGQSGRTVADHGLYKRRAARTIYEWVMRYQAQGLAGLAIKPGRGRHPAFSPSASGRRSGTRRHPRPSPS